MALWKPHKCEWQRHAQIPFLWRIRCNVCDWTAIAPTELRAIAAAEHHEEEENPFPEHFDLTPEDPTHGPS